MPDEKRTETARVATHPRRLGLRLNPWGRNLVCACPFHGPEEESLFFYDALGYWRYRCLRCGVSGDLVDFVIKTRLQGMGEEAALAEAHAFWGAAAPVQLDQADATMNWAKEMGGEKTRVLECFVRYCHWAATRSDQAAKFLQGKGWDIGQAQLYGIGFYSGDPDPFIEYCILEGLERHWVNLYLSNLEAHNEPRITVPARNSKGLIHAVYGIALDSDEASNCIVYAPGPSDIPFNIQSENEAPIVVDGVFDALTADLAGVPGVVSTVHKPLTRSHLYKLKACGAESLTMVFSRMGERRARDLCIGQSLELAEEVGLRFKSVVLPQDGGVDEFIRANGADRFLAIIKETEPDTSQTRRRSVLFQDLREHYEAVMARSPAEPVGYKMDSFPRLVQQFDGIQSGYFFVAAKPYGQKTGLMLSLALDLVESNPLKLVFVTLDTPRKQLFDRLVAMFAGLPLSGVRKRHSDESVNQRIYSATRELLALVKSNRLELWDDCSIRDDETLLRLLREERRDADGRLVVCIDGIHHLKLRSRTDIPDVDERRSAVLLDLYKELDIPLFYSGDLPEASNARRPYLRDADAFYLLDAEASACSLSIAPNRPECGVFQVDLQADPFSGRLKELE
jgi:hypothetical protein